MHNDKQNINNFISLKKYQEAQEAINKALKQSPDSIDILSLQGELLIRLGKLKEAQDLLINIIIRQPENLEALNGLACIKIFQRSWIEAINLLQRVLHLNPLCKEARDNLNFIKSENPVFQHISANSLYKTLCISFPRTAHQLLHRCLETYFREALVYCEFYSHCGQIPCINPRNNFQKFHDLNLNLYNNLSYNFIIQYRHPIESIISWYKLDLESGKSSVNEDNKREWIQFFNNKIVFWQRFVKKWIIENTNPFTYYLNYRNFISEPKTKLQEVIKFMCPTTKIDIDLVSLIVAQNDIRIRGSIKDFKYYDMEFFKEIEKKCAFELALLNLESCLL